MTKHYHVDSTGTGKSCHRTSYEAALKFTAELEALAFRLGSKDATELRGWLADWTPEKIAGGLGGWDSVERQCFPVSYYPVIVTVRQAPGSRDNCEVEHE